MALKMSSKSTDHDQNYVGSSFEVKRPHISRTYAKLAINMKPNTPSKFCRATCALSNKSRPARRFTRKLHEK